MRILLVEDDLALTEALAAAFTRAEIFCDVAPTVASASDLLTGRTFDAVILDLGLPDDDGLTLLRWLRGRNDATPVIILTAKSQPDARVKGLNLGADDYLGKPFLFEELHARLNAVMRRRDGHLYSVVAVGDLRFDFETRIATVRGVPLNLTPRERATLELMVRRRERLITRRQLEDQLFSITGELGSNAVEVYVHRLRRKLANADAHVSVETQRGLGYTLRPLP
ncbi:MAG: response regulator [Acidobacteriaceae bacterium]|jgi:two-component system response regulator TctD|nr:response regulator [Acidobacteriaceae bacterium]